MATPDLRPDSLFRVFLFTDLVGSTVLKYRLGDHVAAQVLADNGAKLKKFVIRGVLDYAAPDVSATQTATTKPAPARGGRAR